MKSRNPLTHFDINTNSTRYSPLLSVLSSIRSFLSLFHQKTISHVTPVVCYGKNKCVLGSKQQPVGAALRFGKMVSNRFLRLDTEDGPVMLCDFGFSNERMSQFPRCRQVLIDLLQRFLDVLRNVGFVPLLVGVLSSPTEFLCHFVVRRLVDELDDGRDSLAQLLGADSFVG